ncbi:TetR/AcrR family transcriptional regulator [Bombella saccharophila]|uniref:TetR/AcrR family transcriptional regulator n=1 Tax=Bombella saccharophila TaxID=2967338 RepID=A0ABT3W8R8_9PROT|nr:TetR/AcrR family transcriptional regulator [Bombella saccharophila]MCX5615203.1 TetR/AcrR family transcriptional regulator [Bombella saccharophila]
MKVACALLQKQGYHHTTMDHIAHHAGMSKKTLYLFFPSKRTLIEQLILEELFPPLTPAPLPQNSVESQLREIIFQMAEIFLCEKRLSLLRTIIGETNRSPSIQQLMTELFHLAGSKTNIQNWLQAQKEAGTLTFANATDAADHLFGLTIGGPMLSRLAHCGAARNKADLQRYLEEGLRIFLHGCTPLPLS